MQITEKVETVVTGYTLHLTKEEAVGLRSYLNRVGTAGYPTAAELRRGITDALLGVPVVEVR